MFKKSKIYLTLILLSFIIFFIYLNFNKNLRVAHAGGEYKGKIYANSIASIVSNYKFTKYFEIDLQLTKDNRLVCLHDPLIHNITFNEIKDNILKNNFCYDETLKKLLNENKEIIIITDFKTNNIQGLNFIKNYFESDFHRFIPQIYFENEYYKVKKIGFKKIIFTFYRVPNYTNDRLYKIIKKMDLYAITMDPARLRSGIVKKFNKKDFFVYVHTVNSLVRFIQYKLFFGADEIYTDNLF
jgi:glycerophosphoryl diester phosphodiesterase